MGDLVPVLAMECIPGDRIRLGAEYLLRLAAMLAPMMHKVDVRIEYFFVPNRLLWSKWQTWITNGGDDETPVDPLPAHPFFKYNSDGSGGSVAYNKLLDYMGLPRPDQGMLPLAPEEVSVLPFAAYQKIYDEYYRDQNLIDIQFSDLNDGDNSTTTELFDLRRRAWEADYFTKALPFAQKGVPVDIPLGDVVLKPAGSTPDPIRLVDAATHLVTDFGAVTTGVIGDVLADTQSSVMDPRGSLSVGATTINDLRLAYRLQEWLEKNARGGTRYTELIRSHFNVISPDARLQRPEYIVGVKSPIQISEVLNTTGTDEAPQGTMAGHGVSYDRGNYGKYFCTEHGYVIGLLSVMPRTAYQQGIPRHFLKYAHPTLLAWPTFANLGEQEVYNREVFAFQADGSGTFGYQSRYMEYKSLENRVAGQFRTTLNFWTMVRIFDPAGPAPQLNQTFVEANPTQRVFAVTDEDVDQVYCQVQHHITVVRALPVYGTPTF